MNGFLRNNELLLGPHLLSVFQVDANASPRTALDRWLGRRPFHAVLFLLAAMFMYVLSPSSTIPLLTRRYLVLE